MQIKDFTNKVDGLISVVVEESEGQSQLRRMTGSKYVAPRPITFSRAAYEQWLIDNSKLLSSITYTSQTESRTITCESTLDEYWAEYDRELIKADMGAYLERENKSDKVCP